jgi:hypothetical protein
MSELEPARPGPRFLRPLLAVAVVLVLLGAILGPRMRQAPSTKEERLAAAAALLATERPELFEGFEPLDLERPLAPAVRSGGRVVALAPEGPILSPRPRFRWQPLAGSSSYVVRLSLPSGELAWSATSTLPELSFPSGQEDLPPGAYVWELVASGPNGEERTRAAFEVWTDEQREAFRDAERAMLELVDSDVSRLLRAHYAIGLGLWGEAEAAVRSHLDGIPGDLVARRTLFRLLERRGAAEAEEYRPGVGG